MTRGEIIRYLILRTLGNFLILFTIFGLISTFGPALYYEVRYRVAQAQSVEFVTVEEEQGETLRDIVNARSRQDATSSASREPSIWDLIVRGEHEEVLVPKSAEFSIIIPKIGANQKVIANVDPENRDVYYEALTQGIAHAKGSNFPGQDGTTYLFAHSADVFWNVGRYNADFYLIKDLVEGDDIVVIFNGERYNYKMTEQKIVDPTEVQYLTTDRGVGEELVLQTCWPPGTTWKRLLVFATPVSN